MSQPAQRPMTLLEFLAWEERQDARFEFDGFQPVAMTGGTIRHDRLTFALGRALDDALRGRPCRPYGPNAKVLTAKGTARYPDGLVSCVPQDPAATCVADPIVVFEVVSTGSDRDDRYLKALEYRATPSIQRYVILEQDSIAATVLERRGDIWAIQTLIDGDVLVMPEIGIELPLGAIYAGIPLA